MFYQPKCYSFIKYYIDLFKLGVAGGLTLGMSLKHSLEIENKGKLQLSEDFNIFNIYVLYLFRFITGALIVQITRFINRKFLYKIIYCFSTLKNEKDIKNFIKADFYFDLFFYFTCYTSVSFSAIFTSFFVFDLLKLF